MKIFRNGFNLIELMVSISIFSILSGVIVANLRGGRMRDELVLGAANLVEGIREANNRTVSGELVGRCVGGGADGLVCPPAGCTGGFVCQQVLPVGGFGVHLSPSAPAQFELFADLNGNFFYEPGEKIRTYKFIASGNVILESADPANPDLTITFRPPKPTSYINGSTAQSGATIMLGHKFTDTIKSVRFERISGAVGIE